MRSGDVVAILSNGGFDGIYEKLPERLKALAAPKAQVSNQVAEARTRT
jgi:UDP-N-acetylmuramate: L-alanyl-gamma-D-glutamyl-meso-diaminopimelate ligase